MPKREVLRLDNVTKSFGNLEVLRGLSLTVKQGEVIVIIGPSGCGKSTLLRTINALEPIEGGKIEFLENDTYLDIHAMKDDLPKIRQKIGMVFQSYDLFGHLSVLDNICLAQEKVLGKSRQEAEKTAKYLLEKIGLSDKIANYPRQLSGGQKQRVAIARALAMDVEIMLFDEVTAALDPEMVREVLDIILTLAKEGMTMLIVTHEMLFAEAVADRIIFMDKGRIIEEGASKNFFANPQTERAKKFLNKFKFT